MQGTTEETQAAAYAPTDRTVPTRSADRASYDKELVHAILDEGYVCHLGFVRDGAPVVLPTLYAWMETHWRPAVEAASHAKAEERRGLVSP